MYKKTVYFALIALVIVNTVDARKLRRNKRPKSDEDSTPQPNVVTYSTFGFNDVGAYDGFVPSSPDYANYLSNFNQESSTRLYAPAFPTALESSGYNNYGAHSQDAPAFEMSDDSSPQASMLQYPQSSVSFYSTPDLDSSHLQTQNIASEEIYGRNAGESDAPKYGAKLSSKRIKPYEFNNTEYNVFSSGASNPTDVKYSTFHEVKSSYESKPTFGESSKPNYPNNFNYAQTHPSTGTDNYMKSISTTTQATLKFPKVIDFTKYKQYYPTDFENKFETTTSKPTSTFSPIQNHNNENAYTNNFEDYRTKFPNPTSAFNEAFKEEDEDKDTEKQVPKPVMYTDVDHSQNYFGPHKNALKDLKLNFDYKDKFKYKPWASTNYTNDYKSWKNPFKGYQYSTDVSNMTFEFDFSGVKKPFNNNNDEIIPASSNVVDLTSLQFPDTDYSTFKKIPGVKGSYGDDYANVFQSLKHQEKYDPEEYVRSLYSTVPTTTTHWGNVYKTSEYTSYKNHPKKPYLTDEINDEVVHIPKRPYSNKYNYGKYSENKPTDWSSFSSHRPYKSKKNKESFNTRFKSEEDLLGLRTHDTSHPSYLPTYSYRPSSNSISEDYDYKKLVEKWRQSYLKAKYKDSSIRDFESYPSETKPIHVPVPKPYPIEVPHPVIVPVPQPYPVRVPVPKPVAVPVIREITIPVEKPVPYPVEKKVPYPVEKLVPVPVEKKVPVPVVKPYPVVVPHIRPVFHHSRPRDEDPVADIDEEDDYMPRPESTKKIPYAKRIRSSRNRSRRPSRTSYQDRNRRRWPSRRPGYNPDQRYPQRSPPTDFQYSHPFRHQEDFDEAGRDSDYYLYCKRTGNC